MLQLKIQGIWKKLEIVWEEKTAIPLQTEGTRGLRMIKMAMERQTLSWNSQEQI
jgi:hypothetical protein